MSITSMILTIAVCVIVVATYKIWKPWLDTGLVKLREKFGRR